VCPIILLRWHCCAIDEPLLPDQSQANPVSEELGDAVDIILSW
jgi:hypothetical protein